jgi:hypothetical protein
MLVEARADQEGVGVKVEEWERKLTRKMKMK